MQTNRAEQKSTQSPNKKNGYWAMLALFIALVLIIISAISRIAIDRKIPASPSLSNSRALALYAEGAVRQTQSQQATLLSIKALSKSLANNRAIRTLAQSYAQQGRNDEALALFKIGGALSWRDSETQLALFETAIKNADIKSGLDNMDALLRRNVAPDEILSIYLLGGQENDIAKLIAGKLAQNPTWRERFFTFTKWEGIENMNSYEQIISHLNQTKSPPKVDEINSYASTLFAKTSRSRALRFWNEQSQQFPSVLNNNSKVTLNWAHSNRSEDRFISDWTMTNIEDVFPYFEDNEDGQTSIANFDMKKRANGLMAYRAIILPPTNIQLAVKSPNQNKELSSSLRWIVKCIDSREEMILDAVPLRDKLWAANISALPCDAHYLQLHVNPAGLRKDVEIRLDNITLSSG